MSSTGNHAGTPPTPVPSQVAKVRELAIEEQVHNDGAVEQRILDPVSKCLQRATHPTTLEAEAHATWRMASRLMAQYDVTQSDLLESTIDNDDYAALGGQSVVDITSTEDDEKGIISPTWVLDVARAMGILFDCKSFSTRRLTSIEWTFYGIAANTVAAAKAFEVAHNLKLEWARNKTGKNVKHRYCLGIGSGLVRIARKEESEEKRKAEEREKRLWQSLQGRNIFQTLTSP